NTLYAGGEFTALHSWVKSKGVVVDNNGEVNKSSTIVNSQVLVSIPDGEGGYIIGGSFTTVGNITRNRIARVNSDGSVHTFNPNANGDVLAMDLIGDTLYVGGEFTSIGGKTRNRIAALDPVTGNAKNFDPNSNG